MHFPVALLTLYALMEILRVSSITKNTWYTPVKKAFLFIGVLSSWAALQSGELAEDLFRNSHALIERHAQFGSITTWIFGILAGAYITELLLSKSILSKYPVVSNFLKKLTKLILSVAPLLAVVGLIAITITGALGGAISRGPDVDPIARFFYDLLVQ